jgi:ribulose-5-phosphate 4-epimerase/fuculose-1-phosphate aldolase
VRDPEFPDRFLINPLSKFFGQIKVSDLQLVSHEGNILIGDKPINQAGFVIHSAIHAAHPEVIAAAHTRPHVKNAAAAYFVLRSSGKWICGSKSLIGVD